MTRTTAVEAPPGTWRDVDEADERGRRRRRRGLGRPLLRVLQVLVFALVVHFLVLPALGGTRRALELLGELDMRLLVLAVALEVAAQASYAQLIRSLLPAASRPSLNRMLRSAYSALALNNVVPSGGTAGTALVYRLLRERGASPSDAGFALAVQSIGSTIVLNVLLWIALVVSIPLTGFNPLYATAAGVGVLLMGVFAALVFALLSGRISSATSVTRLARVIPRAKPERVEQFVEHAADRVREVAGQPRALGTAAAWAGARWLLSASSLWVFVAAFGHVVPVYGVFIAYAIAQVLAAVPITPGGLGVVEATLAIGLVGFGTPRSVAGLGVAGYRAVSYWLPIPAGALAYLSLRPGWLRRHPREALDIAVRRGEAARTGARRTPEA